MATAKPRTTKTRSFYQNNTEFWQDALKKLDLLLQRGVLVFRKQAIENDGIANWQAISDTQIDQLLCPIQKANDAAYTKQYTVLTKTIDQYTQQIEQRLKNSQQIPIVLLQQQFNLSLFEIDILIIMLAPLIDMRYTRIYAYLQDHVNKTHPSLELLFSILTPMLEQRLMAKSYLTQHMTALVNWQLLQTLDNKVFDFTIDNHQPLKLASDISQFLLFSNASLDKAIVNEQSQDKIIISHELKNALDQLIVYLQNNSVGHKNTYSFYFYGEDEATLIQLATILFKPLVEKSYIIDSASFIQYFEIYGLEKACQYVTMLLRQIILNQKGLLILKNVDLFLVENKLAIGLIQHLFTQLSAFPYLVLVGNNVVSFDVFCLHNPQHKRQAYTFHLPLPDNELRRELWKINLQKYKIILGDTGLQELANTFHFSASQISRVVDTATRECFHKTKKITLALLFNYAKSQHKGKLNELAQIQTSKQNFSDIVLPASTLSQLEKIYVFKKHQYQVYHHWNFNSAIASKGGLVALFHGASGTGKTMAAQVLANELHLELYRVDLAMMVSKYIGETEKNLRHIFNTAALLDVVLFFDEADALFGKRTSVNDSHDRYANIETSYLLQCIEAYRGIVILATNLLQNIDEAFLRRFHFIVEFPFPDTQQRKYLWRKVFPAQVPLENIDYDFLAEKLKITGGNIRNIALHAAFLAASQNQSVNMQFILSASHSEYNKLGKLFVPTDFKPYHII